MSQLVKICTLLCIELFYFISIICSILAIWVNIYAVIIMGISFILWVPLLMIKNKVAVPYILDKRNNLPDHIKVLYDQEKLTKMFISLCKIITCINSSIAIPLIIINLAQAAFVIILTLNFTLYLFALISYIISIPNEIFIEEQPAIAEGLQVIIAESPVIVEGQV